MNPKDIVHAFATRTRANLKVINALKSADLEVFEVTQLVNSLLGLLIFPQQRYYQSIPKIALSELAQSGWPKPLVVGEFPAVKNLKELMRYLRNAIAHFNVEYLSDESGEIRGMRLWNINRNKEKDWVVELSLRDVEVAVDKFSDLIVPDASA